ncbi:MAG: hypothetical protein ACODAJ_15225 [Planctomycetota bacterium]
MAATVLVAVAAAQGTGWAVTLTGPHEELAAPAGEDNGVAARLRQEEAARTQWTAWLDAFLCAERRDGASGEGPEALSPRPPREERNDGDGWHRILPVAPGGSGPQPGFVGLELAPLLSGYARGDDGAVADVSEALAREAAAARRKAQEAQATDGQVGESEAGGLPLWLVVLLVGAGALGLVALCALVRHDAAEGADRVT